MRKHLFLLFALTMLLGANAWAQSTLPFSENFNTISGSAEITDLNSELTGWTGTRLMQATEAVQIGTNGAADKDSLGSITTPVITGYNGKLSLTVSVAITSTVSSGYINITILSADGNTVLDGPTEVAADGTNPFGSATYTKVPAQDFKVKIDGLNPFTVNNLNYILDSIHIDYSPTIGYGDFGANSDNLFWVLGTDNKLNISGTGAMENFTAASPAPWLAHKDVITSVAIASGPTTIGDSAFAGYPKLAALTFASGANNKLEKIGNYAFVNCALLVHPTWHVKANFANLTEIGEGAFMGTRFGYSMMPSSAGIVQMPTYLTTLGAGAFANCNSITKGLGANTGANINPNFFAVAPNVNAGTGVLHSADTSILYAYPTAKAATEYTIYDKVKTIKAYAFSNVVALTSLVIPANVTTIEDLAFVDAGLTDVYVYWTSPIAINADVFKGLDLSTIKLHVDPKDTSAYKAANVWKEFNIQAYTPPVPPTAVSLPFTENFNNISGTGAELVVSNTLGFYEGTDVYGWQGAGLYQEDKSIFVGGTTGPGPLFRFTSGYLITPPIANNGNKPVVVSFKAKLVETKSGEDSGVIVKWGTNASTVNEVAEEAQIKHIRLSNTWATYSHTFENVADAEIVLTFIGGQQFANTFSIDSITVEYATLPAATFPITEDFAKFTAGSVEAPDAANIAATGNIPYWLTTQAAWKGDSVYQAGGSILIKKGGKITTPSVAYTKTNYDYIRFSAKVKVQSKDSSNLDVYIMVAGRGGSMKLSRNIMVRTAAADVNGWVAVRDSFMPSDVIAGTQNFYFEPAENCFMDDILVEHVAFEIPPIVTLPINEGFSLFTDGTADAPGAALSPYPYLASLVPASLTAVNGWVADRVQQAGGNAYIATSGSLQTPTFEHDGTKTVYVYVRAKRINTAPTGKDTISIRVNNIEYTYNKLYESVITKDFGVAVVAITDMPEGDFYITFKDETFTMNNYLIDSVSISYTQPAVDNEETVIVEEAGVKPSLFVKDNYLSAKNVEVGSLIEIYNISGQKILQQVYTGNSIYVGNLTRGLYIVRTGKHSVKFVK